MLFEFLQSASMNTNILQLFLTPEFYMGFVTALAGERGVKRYMETRNGYSTNSNNSNNIAKTPNNDPRNNTNTNTNTNTNANANTNTEESSSGYISEEPK